jgi:glutamate formiminotransferase / 5-formyltetrahydrofolate cyclo-ligase
LADLVECVPNFSEGRRIAVVDALAAAVSGVREAVFLDRTSDPDHNRSVLTIAGPDQAVTQAMEAAVEVALEHIDMERHAGQHPRIGAVDVVPFVPLGETSMEDCIELARSFGHRVAERFELPVYLYARAAARPQRIALSDLRRPQYEGLKTLIGREGWEPDFGPSRLHPSGGAVAVGARPFLIAYNINLDSTDVSLAKRIAGRVRERSGGLARVQALGLFLEDLQCAQVSMNLLDHSVTPMWRVWETVLELARAEGVGSRGSELIGLAPLAALVEVADHAGVPDGPDIAARITAGAASLRIRDFDPLMALELRLAAMMAAGAEGRGAALPGT